MITCTTVLHVAEQRREAFERLLIALVENVRSHEPGTTNFQLVRSRAEPLTYLVIEQYVDQAALVAHSQTDYLQQAVPEVLTYLTRPPQLDSYEPVG